VTERVLFTIGLAVCLFALIWWIGMKIAGGHEYRREDDPHNWP
jgi:F0F1-type ATP synthase membrane subunit a